MHCSFCASAGIVGPHDHFLRITRAANAPVCCPKLLSTKCNGCGRFGHTAKYCGELQDKLRLARKADAESKRKALSQGQWMEAKQVVRTKAAPAKAVSVKSMNRGGFAALSVDSSDSEDEEEQNKPTEVAVKKSNGVSWAQVVSEGRKPNADEEEEALPPLGSIVWGAKGGSVWAEE